MELNRIIKLMAAAYLFCAVILAEAKAQVRSDLWRTDIQGWQWDPATSRLKDFTNAGYMNGNAAIPDWQVGVNVLDFGATPNDDSDDSDAFNAAVAACPSSFAVYVPNGRYVIRKRVTINRDYVVIKGQDMFQTVLFFPENANEAYVNLVGYDPADPDKRNSGELPFFHIPGGTHRSIENMSFEFRDQIKMGHWEHKGNDAIRHSGTNSWLRNLYIKNADHGITTVGGRNLSVVNIIFDQFINRNKVRDEAEGSIVGHMAINMNETRDCLFHNILLTGNWSHEFDEKSNSGNVISAVRSEIGVIAYHGMGSVGNLYTDIEVGNNHATTMEDSTRQMRETYWNVRSRSGSTFMDAENVELPYHTDTEGNDHVFVGYGIDPILCPTKTTSEFWYEAIAPSQLEPQNIYLAQMGYRNKPIPPTPLLVAPNPNTGNVIRIGPSEDNIASPTTSSDPSAYTMLIADNPHLKFNLNGLNLASIHRVRLRVASSSFNNVPFEMAVFSVTNDAWSADELTANNRPDTIAVLDSVQIHENTKAKVLEFDVTPFVQAEWAGNKIVSLVLMKTSGNGYQSSILSSENGYGPELIIEQVPSAVAGAPSAPRQVRSNSLVGNIQLDWSDSPESDVVSYNVYRSKVSSDLTQYDFPIGMGLIKSEFIDIQTSHNEGWDVGMMRNDEPYFYRVTAVDSHGYESESSFEIVGTAIGTNDNTQPPNFTSSEIVLPAATQYLPYTATLAGKATDPEGDPLYYSRISGPDWLKLAPNGTITGTPRSGDAGLIQFQAQVNSLGGGQDEVTVKIFVNPNVPDAPVIEEILPGDSIVNLDWSHDAEGSANFTFTVYRSTEASGPYSTVIAGLTVSNFINTGLQDGIAYYYVVTASNSTGESPKSEQVVATPIDNLSIETNFIGGNLTDSAAWDNGLPIGKDGWINMDASVDSSIPVDGYSVLHTGGTILQSGLTWLSLTNGTTWIVDGASATTSSGFRGINVKSGSSFILNHGIINTGSGRDWKVEGANSKMTINGGTLNLGRNLHVGGTAGPSLTINGGTVNGNPSNGDLGSGSLDDSAKSLNFNGGTITFNRINLSGDNTVFNFGGSKVGSLTTNSIVGFGANSKINFSPGTRMSLRISGEDEWAAVRWASGHLTFNGQGVGQLGAWAAVTATGGLGDGYSFVYNSMTETLSIAVTLPDEPPVAPTGLAIKAGVSSVTLNWADHSESDFASYKLYRSTTAGVIGTVRANGLTNSEFTDTQVGDYITYHYVVSTVDLAGQESGFSVQKAGKPGLLSNYATAEVDVEGTLTGSVDNIDTSNNSYQSITEISDGTTSRLEHVWLFDVEPAEVVTFYVEAHHSVNSEGDNFIFAYSNDGVNYIEMATVIKTADNNTSQYFALPSGISGIVYVRVRDADRSAGNTALDSITIDRILIESKTVADDNNDNGINDSWEVQYFGALDQIDGGADSDADGVLDFFEYLYGSNPTDTADKGFRFVSRPDPTGDSLVFSWQTQEEFALGNQYDIRISTDLMTWNPIPTEHYNLQQTPEGNRTHFELTLTHDYGEKAFLRLIKP